MLLTEAPVSLSCVLYESNHNPEATVLPVQNPLLLHLFLPDHKYISYFISPIALELNSTQGLILEPKKSPHAWKNLADNSSKDFSVFPEPD